MQLAQLAAHLASDAAPPQRAYSDRHVRRRLGDDGRPQPPPLPWQLLFAFSEDPPVRRRSAAAWRDCDGIVVAAIQSGRNLAGAARRCTILLSKYQIVVGDFRLTVTRRVAIQATDGFPAEVISPRLLPIIRDTTTPEPAPPEK